MPPKNTSPEYLPLFEFSKVVNSSHDLHFILSTVLRTIMGKMMTTRGVILGREEGNVYRFQLAKGIPDHPPDETMEIARSGEMVVRLTAPSASPWRKRLRDLGLVLLVPILSRGSVLGFIGLGPRMTNAPYGTQDVALIRSLMDLSGSAIEKALIITQVNEANRNMGRKVQELNTLFDLSKEFNSGLNFQKIVRLISFALMGQVGVRQFSVCLRRGDAMEILASRGTSEEQVLPILTEFCTLTVPSELKPLLKMKHYRAAAASLLSLGFSAVIPMQSQRKTIGIIAVGAKLQGGGYDPADLEFLSSLGNLAVISIENARLFQEALEKQKMEDDLLIAREIQQGLLPSILPPIENFDISAVNIPSRQVGGDYYDVLFRSKNEVVIAIGDVSGKGTPASLLMANIQASLRALAPLNDSMGTLTGRMNDLAATNTRGGTKFITFFWGILSLDNRSLRYVNAGHNPPMVLRSDGTIERLDVGGLILGVFPTQVPYEEGVVNLSPGDVLFLYTDGVSEAMNPESEDFTEERMLEIVQRNRSRSSREIVHEVVQAVQKHAAGTEQSDDITLLVLRAR